MITERLREQISFLLEIDKLKEILRQSHLTQSGRQENSAEHSWHLAVMAMVLAEHVREPVNVPRVLKMLLVHDIVEIDAGDTFFYDAAGNVGKPERERLAAERIFSLLPPDQARELRALWEEFETRESTDALFAATMDRLMPLLHNYHCGGRGWKRHGVTEDQVRDKNQFMGKSSEALWEVAQDLVDKSVAQGFLAPTPKAESL